MDMRLDKPWEHQLASHLESLAGCSVEPRGDGTNTPLLNGNVLLLSSDHTAVHNQIVHASSWRFLASVAQSLYPLPRGEGVKCLGSMRLGITVSRRVLTTHAGHAMSMCMEQRGAVSGYRGIK